MEKVNLNEKFALFSDYWSPKIVGELNGQQVKLVKVQGEFTWHHHGQEDKLFLVIQGQLSIEFRDPVRISFAGREALPERTRTVTLNPGEFIIVPKGVEHKPVALEEAHVMLLEPVSTLNTGNVVNEKTVAALQSL
ncbi:cupin domain-containing protein [Microcoleus sp. FACHB-1515]|uniref:cupin domain-containing protein n=1 Tax=Cyanophyceae TaxID=3028117 RepID=UPI0016884A8C|nr:cupin domain-containing protein [Microcoleus sp. FACHB-1515]MBD2091824.1 cupin domain-containing protein [Microcoleus sp. FACHB-1515]